MNTPAPEPASFDGRSPASSIASHTSSSNRRWAGSTCSASRGEMPKNAASKAPGFGSTPAAQV